jgi:hypothetical protein
MFLDSTPSGNDAFFITREQLLPADRNSQLDVYDARAPHSPGEAVGFPQAESHPCGGEGCAGSLSTQLAPPAIGSSEFSGPGNLTPPPPAPSAKPKPLTRAQQLARALKACRAKRDRHKRVLCERKASKRYGAVRPAKRSVKGPGK